MRHRSRPLAALSLALAAPLCLGTALPGSDVSVSVTGLRSERGQVLACLSTNEKAFPDCSADAGAYRQAVAATKPLVIEFGEVPAGTYAVSLLHDENGNGKVDKALMFPREGYGFSRDAALQFGPPRFAAAAFTVAAVPVRQTIRMRYMF